MLFEEESNLFILNKRIEFTIFINKFVYISRNISKKKNIQFILAENYNFFKNWIRKNPIFSDVSIEKSVRILKESFIEKNKLLF